jgi:hypothetical protein
MDNENSISYHLGQAFRLSVQSLKEITKNRSIAVQSIAAVLYHVLFIIMAFVLMRGDSETLFRHGFIIAPLYILISFFVNLEKHIPWQVFWIFTAGAAVEFILNAAHIVPGDISFVLSGFDQSLWCFYIVMQVIVLFLFTLIPYLVYRKRFKRTACN